MRSLSWEGQPCTMKNHPALRNIKKAPFRNFQKEQELSGQKGAYSPTAHTNLVILGEPTSPAVPVPRMKITAPTHT